MAVSQIGNGDFPLNNCAILRQILPESSLDFMKTVLRGEAFANPIAELAGNVKAKIGQAYSKIGTLGNADTGGFFFNEMKTTLESFEQKIIQFESRTNRMSGVISGFQEGEPDLGRILGIGSAYNSALATLASNPEDILKDNFSHGFNSLKQEFGINAIQESDTALEAVGNFLAQFGLGSTDVPGGGTFIDPPPFQFYGEAQQILGSIRTIQQSITNIINAEDAFLAGALAFLEDFALANTALSGVLTDPCMAGKVIGMVASGDLKSLIPELPEFSLPSIDDILEQIPDPEDVANSIKESVEGIVESVQEQVEQVVEETVGIARETVEAIQKSAEEIIEAGENLIQASEQAAADLAENVEEFGRDVDKFFENLEKSLSEEESGTEVEQENSADALGDKLDDELFNTAAEGGDISAAVDRAIPIASTTRSVGSIASSSGVGSNNQEYQIALQEFKRRAGDLYGVSNIDKVASKSLSVSQLRNLIFKSAIDGSEPDDFTAYAKSEFGLVDVEDKSAGDILSQMSDVIIDIQTNPRQYLNRLLAQNRMLDQQLIDEDLQIDPLDPNYDEKFAEILEKQSERNKERIENIQRTKAENDRLRQEFEEEQRKAREESRQRDLADGRIRPSWVAPLLTNHRHIVNEKKFFYPNQNKTVTYLNVIDVARRVDFAGSDYTSEGDSRSPDIDKAKEELDTYSRILGRGFNSDSLEETRDVIDICTLKNTAKNTVPHEMKQIASIYQKGLVSSGNVDTENAAEALREVLSVDELQYYSKMTGNMITFGSTGISGLEGIKKALDFAATLSD